MTPIGPLAIDYLHMAFMWVLVIFSLLKTTIVTIVKFFVPYQYRCKSVKGETVLITGAGSGIGKLIAKRLAKLGAKLVLVDVNEKANQEAAKEIMAEGGMAYAFTCDLSKREEIYRAANEIKKIVGHVDILVNNAGIVTGKRFLESTDEAIEKTMAVNTMAHFWLVKSFLPHMLEANHGHVVSIASVAGLYGTPSLCDYSASKAAVIGFDDSLRNELVRLGKTGVKTTCVCPYYINTGMFKGASSPVIPFIEPEYAADKIVEAILTDQLFLMMPRHIYFFYAFKGISSVETEQLTRDCLIKSTYSMDEFIGRAKTN